jgi:hypothetical protein
MTNIRVGAEWVNSFPGSGQSCHQNNLSYCDDRAHGFISAMTRAKHWTATEWSHALPALFCPALCGLAVLFQLVLQRP